MQNIVALWYVASFPGRVGGEKTSSLLPRGLGTRLYDMVQVNGGKVDSLFGLICTVGNHNFYAKHRNM